MNKHFCAIVPDGILRNIEKNAPTQAERDAAKRTLIESDKLRKKRKELVPVPQPRSGGEKRKVYTANNKTKLPGTLVRDELDPENTDIAVNECFHAMGNTYRLLKAEFGHDSIDAKGMEMIGSVHYDRVMDNAFWDGEQFAAGDGKFFNSFTKDLTVVAHEVQHGVTQYTANLDYQGQSGALNEHMSDVFGAMVEQYAYIQTADEATWLIGGELCVGKIQGRGLRDMLNPGTAFDDPVIGKDSQPAHMDQYDNTFEDNGGVHINSGILNRAFTLACKEIGGYSWEKIGKVWYQVLIQKAKSNTKFQEFANMTYLMAAELHGKDSKEQKAILNGWDAVGIDATATPTTDDPFPIPMDSPCLPELLDILNSVDVETKGKIRKLVARVHTALK